ncbi:MAG TPA: DUF3558 family protein [Actinophytocola sp.]|nr:DUF3558 family protein [Actinophytocola sp.]
MTVRLLLLPMVAVAALALAGCSEQTAGSASPGGDTGENTGAPTIPGGETTGESTESSAPGGDSGTADLQPCAMLSQGDQYQLKVTGGAEDEVGPERLCQWTASGSHTVSVGIADELGLDDVQSSGAKTPMKVGSHDAVQFTGGVSSCAVALGVTDTSRVDVISAANGDEAKACTIAKQAAALVEPKLP